MYKISYHNELGVVRIWQVDAGQLINAAKTWRKLVGSIDQRTLSIIYEDSEVLFFLSMCYILKL